MIPADSEHPLLNYVGIDNGVTGSVAIVDINGVAHKYTRTPTFEEQDYTKKVKRLHRIDTMLLYQILMRRDGGAKVVIERPMVNPMRFVATASALRALEATLIVVQGTLHLPVIFIDSKEWQKVMLPQGVKGEDLKRASVEVGTRLFPNYADVIRAQGDADGLLIAEYARRSHL